MEPPDNVKALLESSEVTFVNAHIDAGWRVLKIYDRGREEAILFALGWDGEGDPAEPDLIAYAEKEKRRSTGNRWNYEDALDQMTRRSVG